MSWMRGLVAALAVCVLLLTGSAGCASSGAEEPKNGGSPSPVGKVLEDRDEEGRAYREVDDDGEAPDVGIEVQPAADDGWDVRLTLSNFRCSAVGAKPEAVAGRGIVRLFVDGHPVAGLRGPAYRLPARYVPHGTHQVTARLYADDGTVWAVDGEPVESTADITASDPTAPSASSSPDSPGSADSLAHSGGRGSPERGGTAS
ncbi:hypothetical protein [Streptomyces resistomycificus]|uniref:Lipoprotein n=1 Tax=Streptomyces resistomycificus TaxID=67356 RepID=A0A0L8LYZ1_9ACTN|nr:hypothetical protein [Streptomyces resistomycificus]KOG43398.1 hypothetical protein ADK37_01265 [Streptomyces resistomycificus]KUN91540.1 hypothetical protein AQJ84_36345 [Streptomyces resistomycificus]